MGSGFRTAAGAKCAETGRFGSQLDGREVACVIYLFSLAGKIPALSSPWKELERGRFMSKAFKFVQFLQAFEGGRLSEALQADPSPLAETLQPLPPGSCWTEEMMAWGPLSSW